MTLPSSGPLALTDIQTEFGGSNPIGMNEYYAGGGLVPAGTTGTYGAVPSSGALSVQNFYGTSNYIPTYVEELFSTWVYTGNDSAQSVPNGINLTGNGGLVWAKARDQAYPHNLFDTARSSGGVEPLLSSNTTNAQNNSYDAASFGSSGFSYTYGNALNVSGVKYVSWTFRKQPKFFDVVTYTGTGAGGNVISHNLGSIPGCIIIKATSTTSNWFTWHIGSGISTSVFGFQLNSTAAASLPSYDGSSYFTSTTFLANAVFDSSISEPNQAGVTYVAYLFASNAGGFGLTGSDNVISCGSFSGSSTSVTLGYEPQYVLIKKTSGTEDWYILDTMRGFSQTEDNILIPNTASTESNIGGGGYLLTPNATGFNWSSNFFQSGATYIYIAIRKGPMKVPTDATKVFAPFATSTNTNTTNFPVDLFFNAYLASATQNYITADRLRGNRPFLVTRATDTEALQNTPNNFASNVSVTASYFSPEPMSLLTFQRAPKFFDEVCYSGAGVGTVNNVPHNLTIAPEFMIVKLRNQGVSSWWCYHAALGPTKYILLNSSSAAGVNSSTWNDTAPTSSVFTLGGLAAVNFLDTWNYVAYLFATCPGVSKVGSYTGTGSTQTINCGFSGGARFVMIKRSDDVGDWFVWNTATGMVSGNSVSIPFNTGAVTNTDNVYTIATGFQVTTSAAVNASGGTYLFLAVA